MRRAHRIQFVVMLELFYRRIRQNFQFQRQIIYRGTNVEFSRGMKTGANTTTSESTTGVVVG
jgi:hypothetical protein